MDWEKLQSTKIIALAVATILVMMIASTFILQESQANSLKEKLVESIEFQNRNGNVATTKIYIVNLENGSEYRYGKTIPGPGMLCDTKNSKGNCETETEPGYKKINKELSSSEYRKQEEDFSTYYYSDNKVCVSSVSDDNIKIEDC